MTMRLFRTFQRKLLFFFLGLYVIVQVVAYLAVTSASTRTARKHINDELSSGALVFEQVIQARIERFLLGTSIMSRDLGFKTAFGSGDRATLLAVMKNHLARIKADIMLVVSREGRVIADSIAPRSRPAAFSLPRLLAAARRSGSASGMASLHGSLYRLVAVPLEAPLPVAWVVAGFRINDTASQEFRTLTGLDVTFFVEDGGKPVVAASTLPGELQKALGATVRLEDLQLHGNHEFPLLGEQFLGLARDVSGDSGSHVTVLMQRSLDEALRPFRSLRNRLALLFTAGLLFVIAGGMLISSRITRPIRRLADGAHSIEQGDYTCVLPVDPSQDEVGRLSNAFNLMREAIKNREDQILRIATYDALTGLVNRSHLYHRMESAIAAACGSARTLALIIMNIERFNEVVATLGHAAGKAILKDMAPLLRAAAPSTALIARFGGDLFAVLLAEGAGEQDAVRVVRDIQNARSPFLGRKRPDPDRGAVRHHDLPLPRR